MRFLCPVLSYFILKLTSTKVTATTATPFFCDGSKRQVLIVRTAESSRSGRNGRDTHTSFTSPSEPIFTINPTDPVALLLRAATV